MSADQRNIKKVLVEVRFPDGKIIKGKNTYLPTEGVLYQIFSEDDGESHLINLKHVEYIWMHVIRNDTAKWG
ncbi:TPA: hypothetical protein ACOWQJ_001995 [Providencia rettgeri]